MWDVSWTHRIIRSWSHSSFETFKSTRNDSKARKWSAVRVKAKRCRTAYFHAWTAASTAEMGRRFACVSWLAMECGYTTIVLSVENRGVSLAMHQHCRQCRISMVPWFYSNQTNPLREIAIGYNWCVWAEHWRKNESFNHVENSFMGCFRGSLLGVPFRFLYRIMHENDQDPVQDRWIGSWNDPLKDPMKEP